MKQASDIHKQLQDLLSEADIEFHILEQKVPVEVQMRYFKYSEGLRKRRSVLTDADYEQYIADLQNPESTLEYKRRILSILAISKQIRAYRLLESYVKYATVELTDWAYLALMEGRIILESELSEEKQIYISTGLGGKGDKLRFFVLITAKDGVPFLDYQQSSLEKEASYIFTQNNCEMERLTFSSNYAEVVVLVPIRANIKAIIDNIINECNQIGNFLSEESTITNVEELSAEKIASILKKNEINLSE